jgi:uncharacterized membrane protein
MGTPRVTRNVIHIISRHSKWPAKNIETTLHDEGIYADRAAWARFTDIALLALGVAFSVAGVIFFFAYNWHNLHKFVKLGIVQGLVIATICVVLFAKIQLVIKQIILAGASVLVGVLFAVFGQIYQTGADAYDFFLGWTVFITLWALFSGFAPLYLIWLLLVNTTIVLFNDQVGLSWPANTICLVLFAVNVSAIVIAQLLYRIKVINELPGYFTKLVALGAVCCITIGIVNGIFDHRYTGAGILGISVLAAVVVYGAAVYYAITNKSLYFLCIIPVSIIVIITTWIADITRDDSGAVYLLVSLFVVISVTVLVKGLITLNKSWHGNN